MPSCTTSLLITASLNSHDTQFYLLFRLISNQHFWISCITEKKTRQDIGRELLIWTTNYSCSGQELNPDVVQERRLAPCTTAGHTLSDYVRGWSFLWNVPPMDLSTLIHLSLVLALWAFPRLRPYLPASEGSHRRTSPGEDPVSWVVQWENKLWPRDTPSSCPCPWVWNWEALKQILL